MSWVDRPEDAPRLEPQDSPNHPAARWFTKARRERRDHYASRPKLKRPPKRAIITMVHNEPVFLPVWLGYYGRFFGTEDMYVLDNDTTDGSTVGSGFTRIPVVHDRVDHTWMVRTIEELQHELLGHYDVVVVTDVDEIIAPVPQIGDLGQYLDGFDEEWVNCLGYEILHLKDSEPPLELSRPILDQRHHWFINGAYDKAAIAMEPMRWRPGFHGREDFHYRPDPDLRLIHLHRADYDICLERHRLRSQRQWADRDARDRWAIHNQIADAAEFDRWFYDDSCFDDIEIRLEEIPSTWRGVF
jgi:hypothetical protein